MHTTAMTELDAVNKMLRACGEQPVNSLEATGVLEAEMARDCLQDASRDVQNEGWHFNTEQRVSLSPDRDGYIVLPANCLRVDTAGYDAGINVVQRGERLYDVVNHTFVFKTKLTVDMISFLDWQDLPQSARNYIAIVAARRFIAACPGSPTLEAFTQADLLMARVALMDAEADTGDYNILTDSYPNRRAYDRRG